jgi:hypothetical protein
MDQSSGTFQMDESGYGRSQADSSRGVTDGIDVGGCEATGVLVSSTPGLAGCDRDRTIKKIMPAITAVNQRPNFLLLISPSVILSSDYIDPNCLFITGTLSYGDAE